jgi:hypothetical protein
MRYRHRYKIAEDYFLRMAMERWLAARARARAAVCLRAWRRASAWVVLARGRPLHRRLRGAGERVLPTPTASRCALIRGLFPGVIAAGSFGHGGSFHVKPRHFGRYMCQYAQPDGVARHRPAT